MYQIKDGSWRATYYDRGRRRYVRGATQAEALAARRQHIRELERGSEVDRSTTLNRQLDAWLEEIRATRRPRTWEGYTSVVNLHLRPHLGTLRIADLEPRDLRDLYHRTLKGRISPATIHKLHSAVRGALQLAVVDERIPRNVAALVSPPSVPKYQPTRLSAEQVVKVLASLDDHRHGPLIKTAIATGCRWGELAGLRWIDVDLVHATLRIRSSAARVPKAYRDELTRAWELAGPKTEAGARVLALAPFGLLALVEQRARVDALRSRAQLPWGDGLSGRRCRGCTTEPCELHELVFPNRRGTPLREDHVLAAWHRLLETLGLDRCRLHDLRHSVATLHRQGGADLLTIRDLLGHADIATSAGVYIGNAPDALRAAADRLEALLAETRNRANSA